jgi:hypothetical protein
VHRFIVDYVRQPGFLEIRTDFLHESSQCHCPEVSNRPARDGERANPVRDPLFDHVLREILRRQEPKRRPSVTFGVDRKHMGRSAIGEAGLGRQLIPAGDDLNIMCETFRHRIEGDMERKPTIIADGNRRDADFARNVRLTLAQVDTVQD